jgi:microcystin-dependent protein
MADPFMAEVRVFGFNFAPRGWAFCNGQLLPIAQNTALFSLLGTTYGGNGQTNFALPDLQGRACMHPGQGPGLSSRDLGEIGGQETVTLLTAQIPSHTHALQGSNAPSSNATPANNVLGRGAAGLLAYAPPGNPTPMAATAIGNQGGSQPHNNLMPYVVLNLCIALQGVYPPRS